MYQQLGLFDNYRVRRYIRIVESGLSAIGPITLDTKCAGKRSAGNPHAAFDEAGVGNGVTQTTAPTLDPTISEEVSLSVDNAELKAWNVELDDPLQFLHPAHRVARMNKRSPSKPGFDMLRS